MQQARIKKLIVRNDEKLKNDIETPHGAGDAGRHTNTAEAKPCMTYDEICKTLAPLAPRSVIKVTWNQAQKSGEWFGWVYEPRRRSGRKEWDVEYRIVDDDGDIASVTAWLPPRDTSIKVARIEAVEQMPGRPSELKSKQPSERQPQRQEQAQSEAHLQDPFLAPVTQQLQGLPPSYGDFLASAQTRQASPPTYADFVASGQQTIITQIEEVVQNATSPATSEDTHDDGGRADFEAYAQRNRGNQAATTETAARPSQADNSISPERPSARPREGPKSWGTGARARAECDSRAALGTFTATSQQLQRVSTTNNVRRDSGMVQEAESNTAPSSQTRSGGIDQERTRGGAPEISQHSRFGELPTCGRYPGIPNENKEAKAMEMGHGAKVCRNNCRSIQAVPDVSTRCNNDPIGDIRGMAASVPRFFDKSIRGTPNNTKSSHARSDSQGSSDVNRCRSSESPGARLDCLGPDRRRLKAEKQRCPDTSERHHSDIPKRKNNSEAGTIFSPLDNTGGVETLIRRPADGQILQDNSGRSVRGPEKSRQGTLKSVSAKGIAPGDGSGGNNRRNTVAVQRTQKCINASSLSDVGYGRGTQEVRHESRGTFAGVGVNDKENESNGKSMATTSAPRFLRFLGKEAPSWKEIDPQRSEEKTKMPLHAKDVSGTIKVEQVLKMARDPRLKKLAEESLKWLSDTERYEKMIRGGALHRSKPRWSFDDTQTEILLKLAKYEVGPSVLGGRAFTVPEERPKGWRLRPVLEPFINDLFTEVPTVKFLSRAQRHTLYRRANWAATIDFSSYYDQFLLQPEVRKYFGTGKYRARTLPMGFRAACAVAQATTWVICEIDDRFPNVIVISYIDNVCILGKSREETEAAMKYVLERCKNVGIVVNEDETTLSQRFEFVGEVIDLRAKKVSLSEKTVRKMFAVNKALEDCKEQTDDEFVNTEWSCRRAAAAIGIAIYGSAVQGKKLASNFFVLRYLATLARLQTWEAKAPPMTKATFSTLHQWIRSMMANKDCDLWYEDSREPDFELVTDASEFGWAACAVKSSEVQVSAGQWTAQDRQRINVASSVHTEPEGIWRGLCMTVAKETRKVLIVTDHMPIVLSGTRGHAKCFVYNELLKKLEAAFSGVRFEWAHIEGARNPMDGMSRASLDKRAENLAIQEAKELANVMRDKRERENGRTGTPFSEWLPTALNPLKKCKQFSPSLLSSF